MPLLPSDPKQQRMLLIGLVPLVALGAYWYFVHEDRTAEIADMQTRLESLETKNSAARALSAKGGPELKKKLALYEQHVARLEELIPKSEEVPDLLHDVTVRAQETGVELNLMRPEKSTTTEFYTKQVYSMSVVGPYQGVGRFLAAVGSLPRIVTPVHMKLVPRTDFDRSGAIRLQAEFQIQTFIAPDMAAADSAGKGSKNAGT
jgi:type IV pilus assembly protein PilO